jgi:hypothetical protein
METKLPNLMIKYPEAFSDDALLEFELAMADPAIELRLERPEGQFLGTFAGLDLLLPTVVAVYVTAVLFVKSFVEGAGKKMGEMAGEDGYKLLKEKLPRATSKLWGRLSKVRTITVASPPEKLQPHGYSRLFCVIAPVGQMGMIKLLVPNDATEADMQAATEALMLFLEGFYMRQPQLPLTFRGGVALLVFEPEAKALRAVDPYESD